MKTGLRQPLRSDIQQRLEKLKAGIKKKKDEARELFHAVLEKFRIRELGVIIPEDVKKQLSYIKNMLLLTVSGSTVSEQELSKDALYERLALADILQAIQSLSTPSGQKSLILATQLEEDLKKRLALQFSQKNVQLTANWKTHIKASDLAAVLGSEAYSQVTAKFGGPVGMLEKSLQLAENFSGILNKVASKEPVESTNEALNMAIKPVGPAR